jgi:diacylglycerol kinase family enzyme
VEVIAACGGDGTNRAVLTEMMHVYTPDRLPRFAILRGGTVNTVAVNLSIHGSPEDVLTRLVGWHNRRMVEPVEERPLIVVNSGYGFLFGAAMGARFFEAYDRGPPGPLRSVIGRPARGSTGWAVVLAARITASSLLGTPLSRWLFEPVPARITVDGTALPNERWSLLVAATVVNVGLQIRITHRALERKGHFHLVASGLPPFELARQFHKTFLSRSLEGHPHFDLLSGRTVIEFERPEPYILDGDLFRGRRIVVENGPRVRVSIP